MKEKEKLFFFSFSFLSLPPNAYLRVFVNDNFEKMTLYTREEVIGRNCRFLQGRYTDRKVVARVREACQMGEQLDVELLNYRKDGVPFWNR